MSCDNFATKEDIAAILAKLDSLDGKFNAFEAIIDTLLTPIRGLLELIANFLQAFFGFGGGGSGGGGAGGDFISPYDSKMDGVLQAINDLTQLVNSLFSTFVECCDSIREGLNTVNENIKNVAGNLQNLITRVLEFQQEVSQAIGQIDAYLDRLYLLITGIANNVDGLKDFIQAGFNFIEGVLTEFKTLVAQTLLRIDESLTQIVLDMLEVSFTLTELAALLGDIPRQIGALATDIQIALGGIGIKIDACCATILSAVGSLSIAITAAFTALGATLATAFGGIATTLSGIVVTLATMTTTLAAILTALAIDVVFDTLGKINTILGLINGLTTLINRLFGSGIGLDDIYTKAVEIDACCDQVRTDINLANADVLKVQTEVEKLTLSSGSISCDSFSYAYTGLNEQLSATYNAVVCQLMKLLPIEPIEDNFECITYEVDEEGTVTSEVTQIEYTDLRSQVSALYEFIKCTLVGSQAQYECFAVDSPTTAIIFPYFNTQSQITAFKGYFDCAVDRIEYLAGNCTATYTTAKTVYVSGYHLSIDWYDVNVVASRYPNNLVAAVDPNKNYDNLWAVVGNSWITKGNVHAYIPSTSSNSALASGNFSTRETADFIFSMFKGYMLDDTYLDTRFTEQGVRRSISYRTLRVQRMLLVETSTGNILKCYKNKAFPLVYIRENICENFGVGNYGTC